MDAFAVMGACCSWICGPKPPAGDQPKEHPAPKAIPKTTIQEQTEKEGSIGLINNSSTSDRNDLP